MPKGVDGDVFDSALRFDTRVGGGATIAAGVTRAEVTAREVPLVEAMEEVLELMLVFSDVVLWIATGCFI